MNTTIVPSSRFSLHEADRIGVAASVLCAIHCGLAPVLFIFLPAFGKIWAHPASHALVALLIVPLAAFSIYKGYRIHRKRWVLISASIGVFFVVWGAVLPAFTAENGSSLEQTAAETMPPADASASEEGVITLAESCSVGCRSSCGSKVAAVSDTSAGDGGAASCVDACCPSLQVSETGEISLHIPPAAIITTLGGIFLIAAHVGNLCECRHACGTKGCCNAAEPA